MSVRARGYLGRNAVIGFCSSAISDTCSNSIRVIKTTTQTSTVPIGYLEALKLVIAKDGVSGLLFRGLVVAAWIHLPNENHEASPPSRPHHLRSPRSQPSFRHSPRLSTNHLQD